VDGFNPRLSGEGEATIPLVNSGWKKIVSIRASPVKERRPLGRGQFALDGCVSIRASPVKERRPAKQEGNGVTISFNPRLSGEGEATSLPSYQNMVEY